MKKTFITALALAIAGNCIAKVQSYDLKSPDASICASLNVDADITLSISIDGKSVLSPSPVSMTLDDGTVYGAADKVRKAVRRSIDETFQTPIYKRSEVRNHFNELTLTFDEFSLLVRAYDDGVAYRFVSKSKKPFKVMSEQADFTFPDNWKFRGSYVAGAKRTVEAQYYNSQENLYTYDSMLKWNPAKIAFPPMMVEAGDEYRVAITDADVLDYPGMYLHIPDGTTVMKAIFRSIFYFRLILTKFGVCVPKIVVNSMIDKKNNIIDDRFPYKSPELNLIPLIENDVLCLSQENESTREYDYGDGGFSTGY